MVSIDTIASVDLELRSRFPLRWIAFDMSRIQAVIEFAWATSRSTDVFRCACPLKIWYGVLRYSLLADHADFRIIVNLNRHVSRARGTQPEIFMDAGLACIFRSRPRSMPDRGWLGVDQVELAFAEIAKRSGTGWIRAFRKHGMVD
jgi:hypothetical protein